MYLEVINENETHYYQSKNPVCSFSKLPRHDNKLWRRVYHFNVGGGGGGYCVV